MAVDLRRKTNYEEIKRAWIQDVDHVVDELESWFESHPDKPKVLRGPQSITEPGLGTYSVSHLDVQFGGDIRDAIMVEPAPRNYPGRGFIERWLTTCAPTSTTCAPKYEPRLSPETGRGSR
jgi:hypothetical protein